MSNDLNLCTKTMAGIYVQQGYFQKAIDIYRDLLKREPHRLDIKEALAAAESQAAKKGAAKTDDLFPLVAEWFALVRKYNDLQKLNRCLRKY
jgi:predicted Zn-dependent protease